MTRYRMVGADSRLLRVRRREVKCRRERLR